MVLLAYVLPMFFYVLYVLLAQVYPLLTYFCLRCAATLTVRACCHSAGLTGRCGRPGHGVATTLFNGAACTLCCPASRARAL